jgi:hypothetical protein
MIGPQQRKVIVKFGVAILALLVIFVSYSYIIPRTEVEVETVYHSSYSALFVQSKLSNTGTKQITELMVKISVWNGTEMLETDTHYPGILNAKQSVKLPPLLFDGPHSDSYELLINIEFVVDGEKLTLTYNYEIADYGNLAWHDQYVSF